MFIKNLKPYLKSEKAEQWKWLEHCLIDFKADKNYYEFHENYFVIDHEELSELLPSIIYLIFVSLLDYRDLGKREKVAWIIPFIFKGDHYIISYEKFGLRLRSMNKNIEKEIIEELFSKLKSAIKIGDQILEPAVKKQIKNGNITIRNKFNMFDDRYKFFRNEAKSIFTNKTSDKSKQSNNIPKLATIINEKIENGRLGLYYTLGMLDAFFSMLEHLCVLFLPFVNSNLQSKNLNEYIFSGWTDKFNRVFKPNENPKHMKVYNGLRNIKEKYRNTFAHGGYEKEGISLIGIHTEIGVLPITLSQTKDSVHYSFFPVELNNYKLICDRLDQFDKLLSKKPYNNIMKVIESGLNISFDEKSKITYQNIIKEEDQLEKFIRKQNHYVDMYINMDW